MSKLEKNVQDWVSTISMSEKEIQDSTESILSNPTIVSKSNDGEDTNYYSYSQMIKMFVYGYKMHVLPTVNRKRKNSAFSKMRIMGKGDTITLPYDKWNAARSSASKLKTYYGVRFTVSAKKSEDSQWIEVVRVE